MLVQRHATVAVELQRAADAAFGEADQRGFLVGLERRHLTVEQVADDLVVERVEVHSAAARADGGQQAARLAGGEDQKGAGGRLFDNLEQRVLAALVQAFRAVEDHDAPAVLGRRHAQERRDAAHCVDGNIVLEAAFLLIELALDRQQVGMAG